MIAASGETEVNEQEVTSLTVVINGSEAVAGTNLTLWHPPRNSVTWTEAIMSPAIRSRMSREIDDPRMANSRGIDIGSGESRTVRMSSLASCITSSTSSPLRTPISDRDDR